MAKTRRIYNVFFNFQRGRFLRISRSFKGVVCTAQMALVPQNEVWAKVQVGAVRGITVGRSWGRRAVEARATSLASRHSPLVSDSRLSLLLHSYLSASMGSKLAARM